MFLRKGTKEEAMRTSRYGNTGQDRRAAFDEAGQQPIKGAVHQDSGMVLRRESKSAVGPLAALLVSLVVLSSSFGCVAPLGGKAVILHTGAVQVTVPPELLEAYAKQMLSQETLRVARGNPSIPGSSDTASEIAGSGESNSGSRNPIAFLNLNFEMNGDNSDMAAAREASAQAAWGGSQAEMMRRSEFQRKGNEGENSETPVTSQPAPYSDLLRHEQVAYFGNGNQR